MRRPCEIVRMKCDSQYFFKVLLFIMILLILQLILGTDICCCSGFLLSHQSKSPNRSPKEPFSSRALAEDVGRNFEKHIMKDDDVHTEKLLIHWRGETDAGYSKQFRHLEFENALAAELASLAVSKSSASTPNHGDDDATTFKEGAGLQLHFTNALNYTGFESMTDMNIEHFNEAMQFVSFMPDESLSPAISKEMMIRAVQRCSLVDGLYEIVASSEKLDDLAELAIRDGGFSDLYKGGVNEKATWCFRARGYSLSESPEYSSNKGRGKRYSSRTRSMKIEKDGLRALTELLIRFGGKVNLEDPDCKIYIFDGLENEIDGVRIARKILARQIAAGPKIFSIAPPERICITNTPLEPIAAFLLCNIARLKKTDKVLDPYCGSCTTLLAAAMIAPDCDTVGIEIAHNGLVNREDIARDFTSRNLKLPNQIICGDSTDVVVRETAKAAVNDEPFDVIVADPPYGIRESVSYNEHSPLEELLTSIAIDKTATNRQRLIKRGGRLAAFIPVTDEQVLEEMLPSQDLIEKAGLEFESSREQPLNDKLSRWLVSYVAIK